MLAIAEIQTAGIEAALIVGVGLALLARLLYKPRSQDIIKDNKPNTATLRGSFIPLVIGTRRVGPVVLWVGNRRTAIEEEEVGGKGIGGGSSIEKTIYYEKAIHALCVGPATGIKGIYTDGILIPGSDDLNPVLYPSGSSITFPDFGTCRIYWGTLTHPTSGSLLAEKLGIASAGPYVMRIEWDDYRLGGTPRWKLIEYIVQVPPMAENSPVSNRKYNKGINPAEVFWQLWTAAYPHGGGMPTDWVDFQAVTDMGTLAATEEISFNTLVQEGESVDRITGEQMQDFGYILPECAGVISPYAIRKVPGDVQDLDNSLLLPPIDEIERVHLNTLGDALVYEYDDKAQAYRTATIDVDDDSVGAIRSQRRVKKVKFNSVTVRDVASKLAKRRQIEDLADVITVKAKGLRGLRAAQPGQPFDLPGVGRVRLISYNLNWSDPSVALELMQDVFDQDDIDFVDPGLPGDIVEGDLLPDLRFAAFELPYAVNPGGPNALVVFRHRANDSIYSANILVSNDGVSYTNYGTQPVPCAGGVLAADWSPVSWSPFIEEGPLITIDANGDEDLPSNLSGSLIAWLTGAQVMLIGAGADAELFFVREWVEVTPGVSYRPTGLVRGRFGAGYLPLHFDLGNFREALQDEPCYIINTGDIHPITGSIIQTGGVHFVKSQPINSSGVLPAAAVYPDDLDQITPMSIPPKLAWVAAGGSYPVPRRDLTWDEGIIEAVDGSDVEEDIVFEVIPGALSQGAGQQGFGQAVSIPAVTGKLRVEVYYDVSDPDAAFADLPLVATYDTTLSTIDQGDGTYKWTYTRAQMEADQVAEGGGSSMEAWSDDDADFRHWKFLLYHVIDTVAGPPIEVRLHAIETQAYNWVPRAENH
jgi:hypothetical protein